MWITVTLILLMCSYFWSWGRNFSPLNIFKINSFFSLSNFKYKLLPLPLHYVSRRSKLFILLWRDTSNHRPVFSPPLIYQGWPPIYPFSATWIEAIFTQEASSIIFKSNVDRTNLSSVVFYTTNVFCRNFRKTCLRLKILCCPIGLCKQITLTTQCRNWNFAQVEFLPDQSNQANCLIFLHLHWLVNI